MLELYGGVGALVCGVEIALVVELPRVSFVGQGRGAECSRWCACVCMCVEVWVMLPRSLSHWGLDGERGH